MIFFHGKKGTLQPKKGHLPKLGGPAPPGSYATGGNIRDFQCLVKCFPVSHIWKHWLLLQKQNLLPGANFGEKCFLPN
jgi:hypothetical protein